MLPTLAHPISRTRGDARCRATALRPAADQLLAHADRKRWQDRRPLRIVHARVADVVSERTRSRGEQHECRIERGVRGDQAVEETADRIAARIDVGEPAPHPPAVLEGREPAGLRRPKRLGRERAEHHHVLDAIDAGVRSVGTPCLLLVHEHA